MKASLFLLFAFVAVALCGRLSTRAYQQQCRSLQCEKQNEACGMIDMVSYKVNTGCINADTDYCNITQSGNGIIVGQCIPYATEGQSCQNRECGLGLSGCSTGLTTTCIAVAQQNVQRRPGQTCGSPTIQCVYQDPLAPDENTCNNGVCKFTQDGASCTPGYSQCNSLTSSCVSSGGFGSYVCQARFSSGSGCIANISRSASTSNGQCKDELNCIPNSINDGVSGTCRAIYSQKEGGACKNGDDCKDGVCLPPDGAVDVVYWGVCADYKKTSTLNKRCADNDDCTQTNGEYCVCVDDEKSVCKNNDLDREYYDEVKDYRNCKNGADLKCAGLEPKQSLKCYMAECKSDFCKLYKGAKKVGSSLSASFLVSEILGEDITDDDTKTGLMCSVVQVCDASSLFTSLPLLVAFAAIVLLMQ